jgi:hypothetical protein
VTARDLLGAFAHELAEQQNAWAVQQAELEQRLAFAERTVEHLRKSHVERSAAEADRRDHALGYESKLLRAQVQAGINLDRAFRAEREVRRWVHRAFQAERQLAHLTEPR